MASHLLLAAIVVAIFIKEAEAGASYNVKKFGAKPDGITDSSMPFMSAWSAACGSAKPATIYVPKGEYLVGALRFQGPCNNQAIMVRIDGTLVAPSYQVLGSAKHWLLFNQVDGLTIQGGTIDGQGADLWACKSSDSENCPRGATSLSIFNSNHVMVNGLTSVNSQMFHIVINGCNDLWMLGVTVVAPGDSPNTDGIHVQYSNGVTIRNSKLRTGDDCVSIGPGSTNLLVENVACGPGHGISIGSLGKEFNEEGVQNVTVRRVAFKGTQNGLRIKSWARPSSGFVNNVMFQKAIMKNVQNPIIIDQNYCPHHDNCPSEQSGVKISNVMYQEIYGISATKVAVKFDCSEDNPCRGITMQDVNLRYKDELTLASSYCMNVGGKAFGVINPASCL
ncbi:hypothetical protein OSB04_013407 [Centaurea solstitialis]|uniref:Polygalacturonase n=1 Tax=Centaurea solstitialis TaxID=347529 RepID=A0AA38TD74_9ASTR|nr:hypothetical protein OSB04_013407 [Centaurea solstitialis]